MDRWCRRLFSGLVGVLLLSVIQAVGPAASYACGCGAMIPSDATARASGELGVVSWDGRTETIDLSMVVRGSTQDAAWIMPAPQGAQATLGDRGVFDRLERLSRPQTVRRYHYLPRWSAGDDAGASAGVPGAVRVTGTSTVGPFKVTTLEGTSGSAVTAWLTEHGYPARPQIIPTMQDYLDRGWQLLAVTLTPAGGRLTGRLSPLRLTFPATRPVYPIRLSRHAQEAQAVTVYVAAPHRMSAGQRWLSSPSYAGWVDGSQVGRPRGDRVFLTKYSQMIAPQRITSDLTFDQAAQDATYRPVRYVDVDRSWVLWLGVLAVVLLAGGVAVLRWRGPRPARVS